VDEGGVGRGRGEGAGEQEVRGGYYSNKVEIS